MKNQTVIACRCVALWCSIVAALLFAIPADGQSTGFSIVVSAPSLSCSTAAGTGAFAALSWSIGAQNNGNAASRDRAVSSTLGPLHVAKALDACTPVLFGDVVTGRVIPALTLTQSSGGIPILTVKLTNAIATSDQLGGNAASAPEEMVSFGYSRISITNNASGTTFCWDVATQTACSS